MFTSVQYITFKANTVRDGANSIGGREVNIKFNTFEKYFHMTLCIELTHKNYGNVQAINQVENEPPASLVI